MDSPIDFRDRRVAVARWTPAERQELRRICSIVDRMLESRRKHRNCLICTKYIIDFEQALLRCEERLRVAKHLLKFSDPNIEFSCNIRASQCKLFSPEEK